ncbi:MAG: TMEM175 family protein [Chitinophagales bacterium]
MTKTRLEAFSDGVLAIVITIMVLELKVPHEATWEALYERLPVFISYVLSFIFIGIYWGNHHHLIHTVKKINGKLIWSNLHLLFWLSVIPFTTGWMGENDFAQNTVAVYGVNLLLCAIAFWFLQQVIMPQQESNNKLAEALEKQKYKGYISLTGYIAAVPLAFVSIYVSGMIFVLIAIIWIVPDKNIERVLGE